MPKQTRVLEIEDEPKWILIIKEVLSKLNLEGVFLNQNSEFEFADGTATNGEINYEDSEVVNLIQELDVKLVLCDGLLLNEDQDRCHYQGSDYVNKIVKSEFSVEIWSISSNPDTQNVFNQDLRAVVKDEINLFKQGLIAKLIKWKRENEITTEKEKLPINSEIKIK